MAPFFANRSCDPFTPESTPCTLGNYINYAVNVSEPADISKTLAFAKDHNIRVIIRNTGHECGPPLAPPPSPKAPPYAKKLTYPPVPSYLGRSTGAGSIAIWTHHLKTITLTTHSSTAYHGPGIRLGAGVQAFEAYAFASAHNLAVVGGECPTVGLAGGYTQGGGHSLLASKYGLAADQSLEWEVIDGRGNLLTATPTHNADLYWALSGGGAGTYAVVWSLTIKAHADTPTSAANLTFANTNPKAFYQAVAAYHAQLLPPLVDAGATSIAVVTNASFALGPIIAPDVSAARLQSLLRPFTDTLDALGIEYKPTVRQFPTYLSAFEATMFPVGVGVAQYGGRLIPRSVVRQENDALTAALRRIVEDGAAVVGVGLNVAKAVDNAVLPAWREALVHAVVFTPYGNTEPWSTIEQMQAKMTDDYIPLLTRLSPNSGAYANEADPFQPNFQKELYGTNYERLEAVKGRYDPDGMFWVRLGVGSEGWEEVGRDGVGGRLCRVET